MAHNLARQAKCRVVDYAGLRIKLYTIGWLAYSFQRHPESIKLWEAQGILPEPLLKIETKWRYYTADEIRAYTSIFVNSGVKSGSPVSKQVLVRSFRDARKKLRDIFSKTPEKIRKVLPNELELLRYALEKLEQKAALKEKGSDLL